MPEVVHFEPSGSMPMSGRVAQSVFRVHDPSHLHGGKEFPRTFEDGPWKWSEQQRYAPKGLLTGHYFSFDPRAAKAEALHYGIDCAGRVLLEVELDLDDVLDLRFEPNVRAVLTDIGFENSGSLMRWLRALLHENTGGNELTDMIGLWAEVMGYRGIIFFGARAIAKHRSTLSGTADFQLGIPVVGEIFASLRDDPKSSNLVVLSGVDLARSVRRYRSTTLDSLSQGGRKEAPWYSNEYFEADASLIDSELQRTAADRVRRLAGTKRPLIEGRYYIHWDGRIERISG